MSHVRPLACRLTVIVKCPHGHAVLSRGLPRWLGQLRGLPRWLGRLRELPRWLRCRPYHRATTRCGLHIRL